MHHVGVALDNHLVGQLHCARFGDAAGVIAAQVDEHEVLGDLFRVCQQFLLQCPVFGVGGTSLAGAGDGSHGHFIVFHPGQDFRG